MQNERTEQGQLPLVPYPKQLHRISGEFDLAGAVIAYDVYDEDASFMAHQIASRCAEVSGMRPALSVNGEQSSVSAVRYIWEEMLPEEGYRLHVAGDHVAITASSKRGRWYAAMTLCQLIRADGTLPCVDIEDVPDYPIRAMSDDISRGQVPTMDHFKKTIRFCSEYKLNVYFIYLEDLFQFHTNRRIGVGRGGLTADEVRELSAYGRKWHVDIAPLFESLGHQEQVVKMPEYEAFVEGEGSYSFSPVDPRTLRLMEDFYAELVGAFSSPYLFAGLDETSDVGTGRTKSAMEARGHARVYADYYNGLNAIARKFGKKLWIYATHAIEHAESLDWIDTDIRMVNYTFSTPNTGDAWWDNLYTYMPIIREKGFEEVVSPSIINWRRLFPDYTWGYDLTAQLNREGVKHGCIGSMTTSWCDDGGENFREYNWYGLGFHAELAWNAAAPIEEPVFAARFGASYFGPGRDRLGEAIMHLGKVEKLFQHGTFDAFYRSDKLETGMEKESEQAPLAMAALGQYFELWGGEGSLRPPTVSRHADTVHFIQFAARRLRYILELPAQVAQLRAVKLKLSETSSEEEAGPLVATCIEALESQQRTLLLFLEEYEALWRATCRIEGLDHNLKRMRDTVAVWEREKAVILALAGRQ